MSDNWLHFIPEDPYFQPSAADVEYAYKLLLTFTPEADEISVESGEAIQFFDPGSNWSGVVCSYCGADAESWWKNAMQTAAKQNFKNLLVTVPCCGVNVSLNDLNYIWPAAFGRFALIAMNPGIKDVLPDQKTELEQVVGCRLRIVWMHL